MNGTICCQCESIDRLTTLYGYFFCESCLSALRLHTDQTILKNAKSYRQSKSESYEDEVIRRLQSMERGYASTRVKLLHILEQLSELQDDASAD